MKSGECPQACGMYIVYPGNAAQKFMCTFSKTLLCKIDEQLNYSLWRMRMRTGMRTEIRMRMVQLVQRGTGIKNCWVMFWVCL